MYTMLEKEGFGVVVPMQYAIKMKLYLFYYLIFIYLAVVESYKLQSIRQYKPMHMI